MNSVVTNLMPSVSGSIIVFEDSVIHPAVGPFEVVVAEIAVGKVVTGQGHSGQELVGEISVGEVAAGDSF